MMTTAATPTDEERAPLRVVVGDRQTGKSTHVLDWFLAKPDTRAVLTFNEAEADRMRVQAFTVMAQRNPPQNDDHAVAIKALLKVRIRSTADIKYAVGMGLRSTDEIAVDNADYILSRLVHGNLAMVTTQGEAHTL